jgi:ATP/maltotriose-dependent transcriptional regulator MalT
LRSGNIHLQLEIRMWLAIITWTLWIPVDAAIGRVEQLIADISGERWAEAEMLQQLACLYAYAGRFEDARAARARGLTMLGGFGLNNTLGVVSIHGGLIELIAGDPAAAERELRTGHDMLGAIGSWRYRALIASLLAEALYQQNHLDEAMAMAVQAGEMAPADDIEPQARCRAVQAKILARRGQLNAATTRADHAVAIIEPTSKAGLLAELLTSRAEVARMAAMPAQAAADLRRALQIYQHKGATPLAERVSRLITELTPGAASQS